MRWHVCGGQTHPGGSLARFLAASTTMIGTIKRKPQQEATGAIAAPTPTDYRTSYPGGDASKYIIVAVIPIFDQLALPRRTKTDPTSQNQECSL